MSATEDNTIQGVAVNSDAEVDRHTIYYYLHAEERKAKQREKYNNDPEVIRKREEKEAKKAAKESEKEANKLAQKKMKEENKKLRDQELQKIAMEILEKRKSPA